MIIGRFIKQPVDRLRYAVDYSEWLDEGELLVGVTFGVTPVGPNPPTVDMFEVSTPATELVFFLSGGQDGFEYKLEITVTTDGGQIKQNEILFTIKDS